MASDGDGSFTLVPVNFDDEHVFGLLQSTARIVSAQADASAPDPAA